MNQTLRELNHLVSAEFSTEECGNNRSYLPSPSCLIEIQDPINHSEKLIELLKRHQLLLSLRRSLRDNHVLDLETRSQIAGLAARNSLLTEELLKVLQLLSESGIKAICLKGLALSIEAYGSTTKRESRDIDLLIRDSDVDTTLSLLASAGYEATEERSLSQKLWDRKTQHATVLRHKESGIEIDVHWKLIQKQYGISLPQDCIWDRSKHLPLHGRNIRVLGIEDSFVFSILHGAKDLWTELRSLLDLHLLIAKNPSLNWEHIFQIFRSAEQERLLFVPFLLCQRFFGTDIPSILLPAIDDDEVAHKIFQEISAAIEQQEAISELHYAKLHLALRKSLGSKLSYAAGRLFIPHEEDWNLRLPDRLFFLYFIIKPISTIARAISVLAKR